MASHDSHVVRIFHGDNLDFFTKPGKIMATNFDVFVGDNAKKIPPTMCDHHFHVGKYIEKQISYNKLSCFGGGCKKKSISFILFHVYSCTSANPLFFIHAYAGSHCGGLLCKDKIIKKISSFIHPQHDFIFKIFTFQPTCFFCDDANIVGRIEYKKHVNKIQFICGRCLKKRKP